MARIKLDFTEPTLFIHELSVRITDINYGHHLAHDRLVSMLHEARAQFFVANGFREHDIEGVGIILADLAVAYKAEAHFGQVLQIEIAVDEFSRKGCDMLYRVTCTESGITVAMAKTGLVFFNYKLRKPVAIPQCFLEILERPVTTD